MSISINFTGHNVETTDSLKDLTTKKLERLTRYFDRISSIDVTFNVEHLMQCVEATVRVPGNVFHATSKAEDMYEAIDNLVSKLNKQVLKHKEKIAEH